jgi:flagellar basal body-associated protein FliL
MRPDIIATLRKEIKNKINKDLYKISEGEKLIVKDVLFPERSIPMGYGS